MSSVAGRANPVVVGVASVGVLVAIFVASASLGRTPGNNAEWVAAFGTIAAFGGGLLLFWSESRARAEAELIPARCVSISSKIERASNARPREAMRAAQPASSEVRVWLHNGSAFPILRVELHLDPSPHAEKQVVPLFSEAGVDRRDAIPFTVPAHLESKPSVWAEFTDVYGRRWRKVENESVQLLEGPPAG